MLAIIYLAAATYFGDCVCRRFFRFVSLQHRIASSFLVGVLLSTWLTFLVAIGFHNLRQPLIAGNLAFFIVFLATALLTWRFPAADKPDSPRPAKGSTKWDVVWLCGFLIFACWLMFATLSFKNGQFQIAF